MSARYTERQRIIRNVHYRGCSGGVPRQPWYPIPTRESPESGGGYGGFTPRSMDMRHESARARHTNGAGAIGLPSYLASR
jgi:hypothetical protein